MSTPDQAASVPKCLIDVRRLSKRFGRRVAIQDLSLSVRPGEICGIAGAQRCGYIVLLSHGQVRASGPPGEVAQKVSASALIVSGPDAMNFADRLESPGVLAVHPSGKSVRLIVAVDVLSKVEALIAAHGCRSRQACLTLEDAALVIAHDARGCY